MQKVTIFETLLDSLSFYRNFLHYIVVFFIAIYCFINFSRRLFITTLMLENAMSALAHIGVICQWAPNKYGSPAARGMHTTLYINAQNRF